MTAQHGGLRCVFGDDKRGDDLAPFFIWRSHNGNLSDGWVFEQNGLDLSREMVFATPGDPILHTARYTAEALCVDDADCLSPKQLERLRW